jgi:hypothetical protein
MELAVNYIHWRGLVVVALSFEVIRQGSCILNVQVLCKQ